MYHLNCLHSMGSEVGCLHQKRLEGEFLTQESRHGYRSDNRVPGMTCNRSVCHFEGQEDWVSTNSVQLALPAALVKCWSEKGKIPVAGRGQMRNSYVE